MRKILQKKILHLGQTNRHVQNMRKLSLNELELGSDLQVGQEYEKTVAKQAGFSGCAISHRY